MRPGGVGISRMMLSAVTLFPEPDSPTMPSVSPRLMWKSIPSTARTTPSSVKKYVFSPLTSSSRSAMAPPLAATIADSPAAARLARLGSQTRLAARVAEPPRPPLGSHYHRLVISPRASSARSTSSASTSLWVTQRIEVGPIAWILTFRAAHCATSSLVAAWLSPTPPGRVTPKMTMLVWTAPGSTAIPGSFAMPAASRRALAWSSASRSTVAVMRVLERDEPRRGDVDVGRPQRLAHLLGREEPARRLHRAHLHGADDRGAGDLVVEDVRVEVEDDFLARARVAHDGDEVAHRARRDEEAGRLAQPFGGDRLQALDRRILLPHVVPDLGAGHRLAHLDRGEGQRVGAQVDDVVHGVSPRLTAGPGAAGRRAGPTRCSRTRSRAGGGGPRPRGSCPRRSSLRRGGRGSRESRACAHTA